MRGLSAAFGASGRAFALVVVFAGCSASSDLGKSGPSGAGGATVAAATGAAVSSTGAMASSTGAMTSGTGGAMGAASTGAMVASTGAMVATTGAGPSGASVVGAGGAMATGDGLLKDAMCFAACGFPAITDPDGDGYGWERQMTCLVATSTAAMGTTPCPSPAPPNAPAPGSGIEAGGMCYPSCSSSVTDTDGDGYGYEHLNTCIVSGTAAALGGLPCAPNLPTLGMGDGVMLSDGMCYPLCVDIATAMPDAAGYGYENKMTCVVSTGAAALQGVPCDAPNPPPPPPPPPAPPGTGWNADYTATMFGQVDCATFGFSDPTNLNGGTCVARKAVTLSGANTMFYGAAGDLSTLWNGAPSCTCTGGNQAGQCSSPPACAGQSDCGQCVEVVCNATGTHSFMDDGYTHDEFCKGNTSVVVQLIDACPHNHPSNSYWCTTARPNHIDISCSAFSTITQGRMVGEIGSVNVYARPVDCSVGLGVHTF